ncbi:MAG: hypothetical protein JWQ35_1472 [Bacteriovoracaceae bacterium]|nr:hypothetical protein [Bacteriovoracaceae bacterium]
MSFFQIYRASLFFGIALSISVSLKAGGTNTILLEAPEPTSRTSFPSVNYNIEKDEMARAADLLRLETDRLTDQQKTELAIIAKTDPSSMVTRYAAGYLAGEDSLATSSRKDAEQRAKLKSFPSVNYNIEKDEIARAADLLRLETDHLTDQQKIELGIIAKTDPSYIVKSRAAGYLAGDDSFATSNRKDAEQRAKLKSFPSVNYNIEKDEIARAVDILSLNTDHLTDQQKQELAIIAKTDPSSTVRHVATGYLAGDDSVITRNIKNAARKEIAQILNRLQDLDLHGTLTFTNKVEGGSGIDPKASQLFIFDHEPIDLTK